MRWWRRVDGRMACSRDAPAERVRSHVVFGDALPTGDGLVTALRALSYAEGPLSAAVAAFVPFPRRLSKVSGARRVPVENLSRLAEASRVGQGRLGDGGRVFVRWSGTEPVLRILVEGRVREAVEEVSELAVAAARADLR